MSLSTGGRLSGCGRFGLVSPSAILIDHRAETTVPIEVFLMVLGAALVHAIWNALVKTDGDRLSLIKLMSRSALGPPKRTVTFM